ncbi:PaaI family thioesterase [soil metagenome]
MSDDVPGGFVPADLGAGFGARFGPVYMDRALGRMGFRVSELHVNPVDGLHGGAMATFADTQLMAIRAGAEEGRSHSPTISLSLDYLAPAKVGDWVEAQVTMVKTTRTMLFTQAIMTVDGNPVARSSAIYRNKEDRSLDHG